MTIWNIGRFDQRKQETERESSSIVIRLLKKFHCWGLRTTSIDEQSVCLLCSCCTWHGRLSARQRRKSRSKAIDHFFLHGLTTAYDFVSPIAIKISCKSQRTTQLASFHHMTIEEEKNKHKLTGSEKMNGRRECSLMSLDFVCLFLVLVDLPSLFVLRITRNLKSIGHQRSDCARR